MKSKTSLFNKAVFKRNLTGNWVLWAGLILLYLFLLPFRYYANVSDGLLVGEKITKMNLLLEILWNMDLFVPLAAIVAVITAMTVFSYLFTGRNANMMHTYPVSRTGLFLTNCVSGILYLVIPVIIGVLTLLIVAAANGGVTADAVGKSFTWIGVMAAVNVFFFSLAVCVVMFVGNLVAVGILYWIVNFLYIGCVKIIDAIICVVCYGMSTYVTDTIGVLTPVVYMIRHIHLVRRRESVPHTVEGAGIVLGYLAAAVVFMGIAWLAYQRKQIETAGDVITVGWLRPIFRWGVAICTSAAGAVIISSINYQRVSFGTVLFGAILFGIIFFFIAQMLLDRSIHVFSKERIRECIVYTLLVGLFYVGLDADIAGIEKKLPNEDEIVSVTAVSPVSIYAEDAETISWLRDIHKQIIASKKEFENTSIEDTMYVSFWYALKDGSLFRRSYDIPYQETKDSPAGQIYEYAKQPEMILKRYFGIHYPDISVYGGTLEMYAQDDSEYKEDLPTGYSNLRISEENANKLYQAIVKDINEGHFSQEETEESIGVICLNIRDEAGYKAVNSINSISDKEGVTGIDIDRRFTYLIQELQELEYLPKK